MAPTSSFISSLSTTVELHVSQASASVHGDVTPLFSALDPLGYFSKLNLSSDQMGYQVGAVGSPHYIFYRYYLSLPHKSSDQQLEASTLIAKAILDYVFLNISLPELEVILPGATAHLNAYFGAPA